MGVRSSRGFGMVRSFGEELREHEFVVMLVIEKKIVGVARQPVARL